ncbi:uncharacterized protein LOC126455673 [Schistocerca serialis cubense]|uniref:uncharacterized protein LOC126455673 n=1 Tax=Schistocerca serialis cubense TaxID=2023355 RepID=UPI00214E7EB6|nr:uncharacterized protein LOC126455673 [Schistocerca serialis cubense]
MVEKKSLIVFPHVLTHLERPQSHGSAVRRISKALPGLQAVVAGFIRSGKCLGFAHSSSSRAKFGVKPCTGRVSLSDVRMPLIWRDTDHFKNKGDYRRFAVFCLARIGTEIYDTTLLCPVDRSLTDLTFPDVLVLLETIIQPSKTASKEITVSSLCDGKDELMIIRTKNTDDQQNWIRHLVQHTKDHRRWRHAAEKLMEIPSSGSTRHSFARQLRQGSLYDETPLIESVSSTDYHRPTVQEIFGMSPSTSLSSCASSSSSPTFRERSLSSGVSAKGNTVRGNWPFSRNNQD